MTNHLLHDGVREFSTAFDTLLGAIEKKRDGVLKSALDRMSYRLPHSLDDDVKATIEDWRTSGKVRRLWAHDASLWTGHDESRWLDWLRIADDEQHSAPALTAFAKEARGYFQHAVVLGMGVSSLCPDVMARTFRLYQGLPELHVLDSTDPAQIRAMEASLDLSKTLFIVSSKSGTTLEPNILEGYFYDRVCRAVGEGELPKHCVVVTDPGSALQKLAEARKLGQTFLGVRGIGGRYSALSNFGMVPAAIIGVDVSWFLDRTAIMSTRARRAYHPSKIPGCYSVPSSARRHERAATRSRSSRLPPLRSSEHGSNSSSPSRRARRARASSLSTASPSVRLTFMAPTGSSPICGSTMRKTPRFLRSRTQDTRSCASRSARREISGRSSFARKSRPHWPARLSVSTPLISPMSRRVRSPRAS